ncbi:MAG: cardiolipin synthase [Clostridia bacterium]|nr:cardiolipin synthase [Clostridia bacterium]
MMKLHRLYKLVYSNKFIAWIMLAFQVLVLCAGFVWLKDYSRVYFGLVSVTSALLLIYEINRREAPEFKMTWMIVIAIIPLFGALMYLYTRFGFISKGIAINHREACKEIDPIVPCDDEVYEKAKAQSGVGGLVHYLKHSAAKSAPYANTQVEYYKLGEEMYVQMKKEMENAKHFIFMEFFIVNQSSTMWHEMFDILSRKVREGVEVRLLYDGIGSVATLPKNFTLMLDNANIRHAEFAPVKPLLSTYQNNRDHRKIIVIDGEVAFTGGINIADEYVNRISRFGHWKDNGIKVVGDAVDKFSAMFLEMWNTVSDDDKDYTKYIGAGNKEKTDATGFVIPYGDCPLDEDNIGKRVYIDLINRAEEYVHIMTPYLVLDNETMEALRYAVSRGVEVKIIIPHHPDKAYAYWLAHTYYPELMHYGVEIYEYSPGFIHAKTMIVDNKYTVVGTVNFDYRSFYLHYECAVLMAGVDEIEKIETDFSDTVSKSEKITQEIYKQFNPITKLIGRGIRILAPII